MLICLSASHKNSTFDVLEKLSVGAGATASRMVEEHPRLSGAVIVATCNRFEAYLDLDEPFGVSPLPAVYAAIDAVSANTGVGADTLRDNLELVHGNLVAEHLFAVTSGLESVVVGEGEIAGQVRRALEQARSDGTTSPELERLFQRASQTSRGVKNRTGIGSAGRSIVRLALELAESRVIDWSKAEILLVGTGRYAGASLAALRDRGAENVRVYSPSGRALGFAASHGIQAVSVDGFAAAVATANVVVTCTLREDHVIDASIIRAGRALVGVNPDAPETALGLAAVKLCPADVSPEAPPQLIIDLGLPRNVAPDVIDVPGVELLDLETISIHAPLEELNAHDEAREIVGKAARKFSAVAEEQSLAPAVVALRNYMFELRDAEIARARSRGDSSEATESALRHLTGVLLHTPMVRARELARAGDQDDFLTGLSALFDLDVELPAVGTASAAASSSASADAAGRTGSAAS
ncbi:glutamyl-tRNA reductase [Cryobacterium frigoriphilum]|uniref:Glutamyl-tRNA reductase n=1 Tax=Cryobacterium frigoriphilum TaxID=1259150 RepID=A0A4R9A119_9MICO|nr:glutamyl-tRNA reductase [Cryobacterium frigoriphilum]TFD49878.1 glutamyl-tRNA reductase [Cryobacterium frigoriphilum]